MRQPTFVGSSITSRGGDAKVHGRMLPVAPAVGFTTEPGTDPPTDPPFRRFAQPRLRDAVGPQPLTAVEPEIVQAPDVTAVLDVPASAGVGQVLKLTAGEDEQGPWIGVLGSRTTDRVCGLQVPACLPTSQVEG
jgi:hypothetical protein